MTVTTPPRPSAPDVIHDSGEPESFPDPAADPEALIEEAHERTRRRRRRYAALALVLALAGVAGYFGLSLGGAAPSASLNVQQPAQPLPYDPRPNGFEVWLVRGHPNGGCCSVYPTRRTAAELGISPDYDEIDWAKPDPRLLEALIAALIAGPSPGELAAARGPATWGSVLHPGTRLLGVSVDDGVVTIDIASDIDGSVRGSSHDEYGIFADIDSFNYEDGGGLLPWHRLSQLVFTVTQFPSVKGVQFKLDGQPVKVGVETTSDVLLGAPVGRPVTRQDYEANNGCHPCPPTYLDETIQPGPVTRQQYEAPRA